MTDEDKCSDAAKLFYQHINKQIKKNPKFTIEDISAFAYEWAVSCGFDHPRCFVTYIDNIELDKKLADIQSRRST
jgi:hypothetical protein